ncbi:helicase-related protein [Anoxybacillus suryakundensis]|uniref:Helicase conserved C-terminal domain n=1 Tax=Anoxybacillus suryakundensis TaxID=1325335 RepID=A0A0K6GL90_9BACL|nr:helicase-related protein [Anoxybacillus suryakundensis]CUA79417.1 Helicase conserved C-terminal domain [Anoxybacillus suryakundensis]
MSITLESSLRNRQHVIESVREEIIGPGRIRDNYALFNHIGNTILDSKEDLYKPYYWIVGGVKEEILQREQPSQRYVSGMLFPVGTIATDDEVVEVTIKDDVNDDETLDQIFEYKNDVETTETEGDIELFPQKNDFMPSTIGMTFCVDKNVSKLKIVVKGGSYTPHKVRVKGDTAFYTWWLREGVEGVLYIPVKELYIQKHMNYQVNLFNAKNERASQFNIQVQARLREINNFFIITTSATNRSDASGLMRDQVTLFQAEMLVETIGNASFSPYPKLYQLNDILSEEDASTDLLYRHEHVYAFGHGCATDWDQKSKEVKIIQTTFMPEYETISMTPDVELESGKLTIKMSDLAGLSSQKHPKEILQPLTKGYENWIIQKEKEIPLLPPPLQPAATRHIELCWESLRRMNRGLELLEDEQILRAFQLANLAILLQQENGKVKRNGYVLMDEKRLVFDKQIHEVLKDETKLNDASNTWRAFQIAFFLMSIESLADETSKDREIVDLIWFPTGGGKTEAYLGVVAFQMILRRLRNPLDAGVDVIMRYTLRLLTADQFQRASRLMCALEYIRRKNDKELGHTPFSIGIWVGSKTTPNKNIVASQMLSSLINDKHGCPSFIVHTCPWCGAHLGYYSSKDGKKNSKKRFYLGYKMKDSSLIIHCPDKKCDFHNELPIYIVDETIYEKRPTFLIGTIDKFVQLVWEPKARSLFGIDHDGNHFVSPPSVIIQDELHLISGPLGTLTGLFEVLIEELCIKKVNDKIIKPKIIAATATIKHFKEHVLGLFGRKESRLFPSPGLEHDDSFFSRPARYETGELKPGRKYVGVYTSTVGSMMAQVMTFSSILQSSVEIKEDERDPYWTLLAFYNTLRELGGGLTLAQTDIPQYLKAMEMRKGRVQKTRYINNFLELTSRKQSHEISQTIDDLKASYVVGDIKNKAIDLCFASNIIEVGVDIDRLSVMAIVGQPKMTAQYIQVSGRVGRRWWERPGLIFTIYLNTKSRDKSHFEHFREYHQKLYAQVEATSVTPFSDSCIERALPAVVVGFIRQALTMRVARTPDPIETRKYLEDKIYPFYRRLVERAELVDIEQVSELKDRFKKILKNILEGSYTSWKVDNRSDGFMYPAGATIPITLKHSSIPMINSMRNVDAECRGIISNLYNCDKNDAKSSSWEELFT